MTGVVLESGIQYRCERYPCDFFGGIGSNDFNTTQYHRERAQNREAAE